MDDYQMACCSGKAEDVIRDFPLRVGNDQAVTGQHPIRNHRQNYALCFTTARSAERQDTSRCVLTIQAKPSEAVIQAHPISAPECSEEGNSVGITSSVATILAVGTEMRRPHYTTIYVR